VGEAVVNTRKLSKTLSHDDVRKLRGAMLHASLIHRDTKRDTDLARALLLLVSLTVAGDQGALSYKDCSRLAKEYEDPRSDAQLKLTIAQTMGWLQCWRDPVPSALLHGEDL
jgi:hypothetical protein